MPIGVVFEGSGTTQAQYDQGRNQVAPGDQAPPGCAITPVACVRMAGP